MFSLLLLAPSVTVHADVTFKPMYGSQS